MTQYEKEQIANEIMEAVQLFIDETLEKYVDNSSENDKESK